MEQRRDNIFILILQGALIGMGCIMPGVSGAVLAVTLGLYRPMLDALAELRQKFLPGVKFLAPVGFGAGLGFLLGAVILDKLLALYTEPLLMLFVGMIIGGIPAFLREANSEGFRLRWLLAAVIGAALAAAMTLLESDASALQSGSAADLTLWQYLISGAIIAIGSLVPGISTSFVLIYLGWYGPVLDAISSIAPLPCAVTVVGIVLCGLLTLKLIRWLFSRFRGWAYYTVLGFLLGSIALVIPTAAENALWWAWLMLLPGGALGYIFTRK